MTPALEIRIETEPELVWIQLCGKLTLGPQLRRFGRQAQAIFEDHRPRGLLLDFKLLGEIDSAGLGELVILYTTASSKECRVCVLHPSARILRLFETTKLSGILRCFDDDAEARHWVLNPAA